MNQDDFASLREMDDWCRENGATWALASHSGGTTYTATIIADDGRKRFERNGRSVEDAVDGALDRAQR